MTSPPDDAAPERARSPFEGDPTRLDPLALVIWTWRGAFSLLVLIVVTGWMPQVGAALLGLTLVGIILRWMRFRWHLEPDAVVINEGILIRKRRVIRRDRIQTVDLERTLLHRILGVTEVRIEAIGAQGTEGSLVAVDPSTADALRRTLLSRSTARTPVQPTVPAESAGPAGSSELADPSRPHGRPDGEPLALAPPPALGPHPTLVLAPNPGPAVAIEAAPDPMTELAHAPPERLVLAGLTGGRVGIAAALAGFFFQVVPDELWIGRLGTLIEQAPDPTTWVGMRVLVVMVVFALLAGFFLSVVATVFAYWDFTLSADDEMLAVRRGLLTEHRDTVPFRRIQAVRIEENLVRRLLGLASLRAVVAGRAGTGRDEGTDYLLPIGRRAEVHRLARAVIGLPEEGTPEQGPPHLHPMPPRARRRRWTRALLATGAITAATWFLLAPEMALDPRTTTLVFGGVVLVLAGLLAEGAWRGLGWDDLGTHAIVREGVVNRVTTLVPVNRLQVLETSQNPFQRIAGLATLHLRVARPLMGTSPRALDLSLEGAEDWREELATRVASGGR